MEKLSPEQLAEKVAQIERKINELEDEACSILAQSDIDQDPEAAMRINEIASEVDLLVEKLEEYINNINDN